MKAPYLDGHLLKNSATLHAVAVAEKFEQLHRSEQSVVSGQQEDIEDGRHRLQPPVRGQLARYKQYSQS